MFDRFTQQKRIFIAVLISFVFLMAWDYFYTSKQPEVIARAEQAKIEAAKKQAFIRNQKKVTINQKDIIATIENEHFKAQFNKNGNLISFVLKDEKFKDESGLPINLINAKTDYLPMSMHFYDEDISAKANEISYVANKSIVKTNDELILTQDLGDVKIIKSIIFDELGAYKLNVKIEGKQIEYIITPGLRPDVIADSYANHGGFVLFSDDTNKLFEDDEVSSSQKQNPLEQKAMVLAASDRYYTTLFYNFENPYEVWVNEDSAVDNNTILYIRQTGDFSTNGYIGPKEHKVLKSIDKRLSDVVEYGWFSFIARPMFLLLHFLHSKIGNWGWSIVVLTLIIRVLLYPLTHKSMVSMQKLKVIAPQLKEIQEKYRGDPQKMNAHTLELYRKHKANPMGGCLPIFIQIPIFFAIYRVLLNAIELKAAPWALWIDDLSLKDPYYVLPILMGGLMFLQQQLSASTVQDKTQALMLKIMPIAFTFFFISFPAGLTLYYTVNNACSLIQQLIIRKAFDEKKQQVKDKK